MPDPHATGSRAASEPTNAERALIDTATALAAVYKPEGVIIWLTASQPRWRGQSALDLIRKGDHSRVVVAAWQLADSAYA